MGVDRVAILFRDTFTESSNTNLIDHTPEQGGPWVYEAGVPDNAAIVRSEDELRLNGSIVDGFYVYDGTANAGGYIATTPASSLVTPEKYCCIRLVDSNNFFGIEFRGTGSSGVGFVKSVGGVITDLYSETPEAGAVYYLDDNGNSLVFKKDNGATTTLYTENDSEFSTETKKGFVSLGTGNSKPSTYYESGTLEAPTGVTINSLSDYSAKPRDANGDATFTVSGGCPDGTSAIEYSFDEITWLTLDASPSGGAYSGTVVVNGQTDIFVRSADDNALTASVVGITSAMPIVLWGQSNCDGRGINNQAVASGSIVPLMYKSGAVTQMADPTGITVDSAGSLWPLVVKYFIDQGIPVVMANVAQGGKTVAEFEPSTSLYSRISDFAANFGSPELAISVIGEADSGGTTKADFKTRYLNIAQTMNTDYGTETYAVKFPVGTATNTTTQTEIREAYDELIDENAFIKFGGDLSVIDIDSGIGHDSLHLKTDSHLSEGDVIIRSALAGIVPDVTKPVITLLGTPSVVITNGSNYTDAGATASDNIDGDITSNIVTVNPVNTNVSATYTVTYNVTDSAGNAADEVTRTVTVQDAASDNQPPTSNAGADQTNIAAGATVTLNGTGSTDSDGTIVSYAWTQTAGDIVTLISATSASPTFTAPTTANAQTLTFELTVTDDGGLTSAPDSVDVQVNALTLPSVSISAVSQVNTGQSFSPTVTVSGYDNLLWECTSGQSPSFSSTTAEAPFITLNEGGVHTFRLTATNISGSVSDTFNITGMVQVVESALNLSWEGLPDGTYTVLFIDRDNDSVLSRSVTSSNEAAAVTLPLPVGTKVDYYWYNETSGDAVLNTGATE